VYSLSWKKRDSGVPMSSSIVEIVSYVLACEVEKGADLEKGGRPVACAKRGS
jgi:hypothetical protein